MLALEASGAGMGVALETDDGDWRPVVQMVGEDEMEQMVAGVRVGMG